MGRIREDRRWKCKSCGVVSLDAALLTARSPFLSGDTLTACPLCKCCDEGFDLLCDEPGCKQDASGGWPTGDKVDAWGGYRQTCYAHREPPNVEAKRGGTQ